MATWVQFWWTRWSGTCWVSEFFQFPPGRLPSGPIESRLKSNSHIHTVGWGQHRSRRWFYQKLGSAFLERLPKLRRKKRLFWLSWWPHQLLWWLRGPMTTSSQGISHSPVERVVGHWGCRQVIARLVWWKKWSKLHTWLDLTPVHSLLQSSVPYVLVGLVRRDCLWLCVCHPHGCRHQHRCPRWRDQVCSLQVLLAVGPWQRGIGPVTEQIPGVCLAR